MGILSWIILGALAGWVASMIMKTDGQQGWLGNIIVGIVGAVVGGWIAGLFGMGGFDGFNVGSFLVALVGSLVVLFVYKKLAGRKAV